MSSKNQTQVAANMLRMIPTKWAIALVAVLIGYVLLQPTVNQWFGWKLPSLAALDGDEKKPTAEKQSAEKPSAEKQSVEKSSASKSGSTKSNSSQSRDGNNQDDRTHGFLKEIGRNRFESPAGLIYGPGSEEGHRLKHIERHLEDQPSRPGSHGVFEGDMESFLEAIDKAYLMAKKGGKGTKAIEEDDSTVYEAPFDKPIGYLGGSEGKRRKNPGLKKLRIVVRGEFVITAFPIQ